MSYDITNFKVKKMHDLVIPMKALKSSLSDWNPKDPVLIDPMLSKVRIDMGCGQSIEGILTPVSGRVAITDLRLSGDCSGSLMELLIKPALKESTGYLEAIMVWEGGEVEKLVSFDGQVSVAQIEL